MILFLDTISPLPKFVLIDNFKIKKSIFILEKSTTKISDNIISKFLHLEKENNYLNKISKLVVCTGPGSYTSLRVGIAFMYGQSISSGIKLYGISGITLLSHQIKKNDFNNTLILISSSKNQNYICTPLEEKFKKYAVNKVNNDILEDINLINYKYCITNYKLPDSLKEKFKKIKNIKIRKLESIFNKKILKEMKLEIPVKPIYTANYFQDI